MGNDCRGFVSRNASTGHSVGESLLGTKGGTSRICIREIMGQIFLAPGALTALASKSVKSAQELAAIAKNIQIVQDTLILETAAGIGDGAKIAEMVEAGHKMAFLADELGLTAQEMGQLKQAGNLEATIAKNYEHLSLSRQESIELHKKAEKS